MTCTFGYPQVRGQYTTIDDCVSDKVVVCMIPTRRLCIAFNVLLAWFSATACATNNEEPNGSSDESIRVSSQAVVVRNLVPFTFRFTRVHVGSDSCGGKVEPEMRTLKINGVEQLDGIIDLPDCDENGDCPMRDTFTVEVPRHQVVTLHADLWDADDGFCGDSNREFSMDLEVDPTCNRVVGGSARRHLDGNETGSVEPGASSIELGNWGYEWEVDSDPDADLDGIPDCWEKRGWAHTDGDGLIDLNFGTSPLSRNLSNTNSTIIEPMHDVAADPNIPDVYIEVDWMDCNQGGCGGLPRPGNIVDTRSFEPPNRVLDLVEQAFEDNGYNLHFVKSEALPVNGVREPFREIGPMVPVDTQRYEYVLPRDDFLVVKQLYIDHFGNPGDATTTVEAKKSFFRYNVWNHAGDGNLHGNAWDFGDIFHVAHDPTTLPGGNVGRAHQFWAEVLMHELGHTLGLGHGGGDFVDSTTNGPAYFLDGINNKPNYLSIMNYSYGFGLDDPSTGGNEQFLRYNTIETTLDECSLDENVALLSGGQNYAMKWTCPEALFNPANGLPLVTNPAGFGQSHVGPDWNCNGLPDGALTTSFDLNGDRICILSAVGTPLRTLPFQDDEVWGGKIVPNLQPTLQTLVVDPNDIAVVSAGMTVAIEAGLDGILQTIPHADDEVVEEYIVDGLNRTCDTIAFSTDVEVRAIGHVQPCALVAKNDWKAIRVTLTGNGSGPSQTGWGVDSRDDWRTIVETRSVADLVLTSSLHVGTGRAGREVTLTYSIDSSGPDAAQGVSLNVRLPEGTDLIRCTAPGGGCLQVGDMVAASFESIPADESRAVTLSVKLGCELQVGQDVELSAALTSKSNDPDLSTNASTESVRVLEFLGFESSARRWVVSYTGDPLPLVTGNSTEGTSALSLGTGYTQFESPTFDTAELGAVGDKLIVDVHWPVAGTTGGSTLQLSIDIPSAGIWSEWIGLVELGSLSQGSWHEVAYALPTRVRDALLGSYPDARIKFQSNIAVAEGAVLLDHVRLGGEKVCQTALTPPATISSSVLTFDDITAWTSAQTSLTSRTDVITQGTAAVQVGAASWARLTSRAFSTNELVAVGSQLGFDVFIPDLPADFHWFGGMNAYLECPSAGLWNTHLGYNPLQILYDDEFNRVEFDLPPSVVDVLAGSYADCRIHLDFALNPSFGPLILDNGGFIESNSL